MQCNFQITLSQLSMEDHGAFVFTHSCAWTFPSIAPLSISYLEKGEYSRYWKSYESEKINILKGSPLDIQYIEFLISWTIRVYISKTQPQCLPISSYTSIPRFHLLSKYFHASGFYPSWGEDVQVFGYLSFLLWRRFS